jgi:putative tryptophan/tyrosine transport system substrate-binding protein
MNRRQFLMTALVSALSAPGLASPQPARYRIGILGNVPLSDPAGARLWGVFGEGLRELGYEDGRTVTIVHRSSEGQYERLPALAADLVRLKVDVIVAPAAQNVVAARQASPTIPIVMVGVGDPVGNGLVASLAHPGGNVTGSSFLTSAMVGKQLALLKEISPRASRLAILINAANPGHRLALEEANASVHSLGVQLQTLPTRGPDEFDKAFGAMARERAGGLLVPWDGMFLLHLVRLTQLAAKTRLPAMYGHRGYVDAGGLACYGPSATESFRRAATYVDKILKGAKPGDLPVEQPTTFEFVINAKTARSLGLTISPSLRLRADQVIE